MLLVLSLLDELELLLELDDELLVPRREPNGAVDGRGRLKSEVRGRLRLNKLLFSVVDEIASVVDAGVAALVSLREVKSPDEEKEEEDDPSATDEECDSCTVDDEDGKDSDVARVDSVTVLALVSSLTSFLVVSLGNSDDSPSGSLGFRFRFLKSGRPFIRLPLVDRPVDGNGRRMEGRTDATVVVDVVVVVVRRVVVLNELLLLKRLLRVGPNRLGVGVVVVTEAVVLVTDASFDKDAVDAEVTDDVSLVGLSLSSSLSATRVRPNVPRDPGRLLGRVLRGALTRARVGLGVVVVVVELGLTVVAAGRLRVSTLLLRSRELNRFRREP